MMKLEPLPGVGVEVTGCDIHALKEDELQQLRAAFTQYGVLFFRGQDISERDHITFAERWGDININRFFAAHTEYPQIAMVTKEKDQKLNIGGGWHTDHSYDACPALGSILVARELPSQGGETWFTSMHKAYDALSDGLKRTLHGLRAVHSAKHRFGTDHRYNRAEVTEGRIGNAEAADVLEDVIHPVVIRHPLSGKPTLYVNPDFTLRFEGWSAEDSAPLLEYLYQVAVTEPFITKFHWEPGSIAFWDNRATWHYAPNDYHGERREMHRITIEGGPLSAYHRDSAAGTN
jgi:taurine dioxygenase